MKSISCYYRKYAHSRWTYTFNSRAARHSAISPPQLLLQMLIYDVSDSVLLNSMMDKITLYKSEHFYRGRSIRTSEQNSKVLIFSKIFFVLTTMLPIRTRMGGWEVANVGGNSICRVEGSDLSSSSEFSPFGIFAGVFRQAGDHCNGE